MAVVASAGTLVPIGTVYGSRLTGGYLPSYSGRALDYETIWRTQPALRTVVSFLARNVAQLGLALYERVSDTDRVKVTDHPAAVTLDRPAPDTTAYELVDALVHDIGIWDNAFLLKVRRSDSDALSLLRLPPRMVEVETIGNFTPTGYRIGLQRLDPTSVIHFRGYSPSWGEYGCSPIEALRRILDEDLAAGEYREQFWRSGARVSTVIKRPPSTPWSAAARERFRDEWRSIYSGVGDGVGGTPILEDGMELQNIGFNAEQSQYIEARKLSREEVAAVYFVAPPFVGILDHATFSNITEQHRNLYQDTLGPWLQMLSQRLDLALLPEWSDTGAMYSEFNLSEKMRGSFEEQATSYQTAVGAAWMTRNEARARQNLPAVDGGDDLVTPLNVLTGGQASPTAILPPGGAARESAPATKADDPLADPAILDDPAPPGRPEARPADAYRRLLDKHFTQQRRDLLDVSGLSLPTVEALPVLLVRHWTEAMAKDLRKLNVETATNAARKLLDTVGADAHVLRLERLAGWAEARADGLATGMTESTTGKLADAVAKVQEHLDPVELVNKVFDSFDGRVEAVAEAEATGVVGQGQQSAAEDADLSEKTWNVTSASPRPSHASMDGETVPIPEPFSNGLRFPGDGDDVDETAGCTCEVTYA